MKTLFKKFSPLFLPAALLVAGGISVRAQDVVTGGDAQNIVFVYRSAANNSSKSVAVKARNSKNSGDAGKFDGRAQKSSASKKRKDIKESTETAPVAETTNAQADAPILAGGILNGLTTYFETTGFSAEDLKKYRGDEIKVQVTVNAEGEVTDARAKSGPSALLREAAVEKARRASFYRSRFMGDPISLTGELIYVVTDGDDYKKYDNSPNKTPLAVSGGILNGKEISSMVNGARVESNGEVKVQVTIDEEGRVTNARAVSGNPALYKDAVESAGWWTFPRTSVLGNKVKVNGFIVINFKKEIND